MVLFNQHNNLSHLHLGSNESLYIVTQLKGICEKYETYAILHKFHSIDISYGFTINAQGRVQDFRKEGSHV